MDYVLGYELDDECSDFVNEGDEAFGTKPYEYTTNLYSCVGIYAVSGDIKYIGHINVRNRDEFINGKAKKVRSLFDGLLERKEQINDTIYVGLVFGVSLDEYQRDKYYVIEDNLGDEASKLKKYGLNVEVQDSVVSENIVIDGEEGTISFDDDIKIEYGTSQVK